MGRLTVGALRAVLVVVLAGTVFVQALMVWALVSGSAALHPDRQEPLGPGPLPLRRHRLLPE
ncbi:hypothetical protein AB0B44_43350, partial [Streptomyces sp. NPDC041003]